MGWVETGGISMGTVGYVDWGGDACGFPLGAMPPTIRPFIRGGMSR